MNSEAIQKALEIVSAKVHNDIGGDVITRVVVDCLRDYQRKLNVGVQDSFSDLIDLFKQKISEVIFDVGSNWKVATQRTAELFPTNCRFCYTKSDTTLVVIEEKPQVRSLMFGSAIASSRRYGVALPYTVFVIIFRNGQYTNLYAGWRTSPLSSLDDGLYKPVLTNIHENLAVCTGPISFVGGNLSQQAEEVVSHFWNSEFNGHLSDTWENRAYYHPLLKTPEIWEESSKDDSTFILRATFDEGAQLRHIIDNSTKCLEEPDETGLRHRLTEEIDRCVEDLFKRVMYYFQKSKFERHYPKDVEEVLNSALEYVSREYNTAISALQEGFEELCLEVGRANRDSHKWEKRGKYWNE